MSSYNDDEDQSAATLKRWLANVESAQIMWASVPELNVSLGSWRQTPDTGAPGCGTICCFGGWCAWWPEFMAQGVEATRGGAPCLVTKDQAYTSVQDYTAVSAMLFGEPGMFDTRHGEEWYADPETGRAANDHSIVADRLQTRYMALCMRLDC